jgi:solute carrier family 25 (mitochondrial oxoglutarate transporter), member 11
VTLFIDFTMYPLYICVGISASLMRQAVYGTARLGLHRVFSEKMKEAQGGGALPAWKTIASSMGSGAIASVIGNPFDISLVRMQADSLKPAAERRNYKNVFDAIGRIAREEGVLNLWRGFEPTVLRAMAMNVGMMATYDIVKGAIASVNGENFTTNLMSSAVSGLACVTTSLPFDLIKTRLQNMKAMPDGTMPYKGVIDCASKILVNEGPLAFWTGFGAYYGRTAPHAMIILISLEQLNALYKQFLL